MCNLKTSTRQALDILRLHFEDGFSLRKTSKTLNISRKTVTRIISRFAGKGLSWPVDNSELSVVEEILFPVSKRTISTKEQPDMQVVFEELKIKGATLQQLHSEYLAQNPNGIGYSRYCSLYRDYKKSLKRSLRIEHYAGEKVFVDYAGPTITVHIGHGETRQAQIFVGVLGASNYIYADAVWGQSIADWIGSHVRMFEHFGGVPVEVVCDNLKSGVSRASRTNPIVQSDYADMARHFNTIIFPARAYKPKDKSKAEGGVLIVERWIMFRIRNQVFTSLKHLNDVIAELLIEVNARPFKNMPGNRIEAFERMDKPALKPLPVDAYEYRRFQSATVGHDYHVKVEGHFYSVPNKLARCKVEAIYSAATVEIMYKGNRVAIHPRSHQIGGHSTIKSHMPEKHRQYIYSADEAVEWSHSVGFATENFMKVIIESSRNQSATYRNVQRVKSLAKSYGESRLERACQIILEAGGDKVDAIESVLENNIDSATNKESSENYDANFEHSNIRGSGYYH